MNARSDVREYALVVALLGGVTAAGLAIPPLSSLSVGLLYLLVVILMSLRVGRWPMLLAGLLSALLWEFFFVEPRFQFRISGLSDALMVAIYLVVALVAGQLAARIRQQAGEQRRTEESERLQRTLLDSVSHELRTPLAVITAALESLRDAPARKDEAVLLEMGTAVQRLNRLVGNLLNQTRLESGVLQARFDWVDASDILRAAVNDVRDALAGREVAIVVADDLPPVWSDGALTEHALANLVLNAALYTPPAAPIRLSAFLVKSTNHVGFAVADRGPGLPKEFRDRMFQKFQRGQGSRPGGLGLGLSIARGFALAQGGDVVLSDNPGGGAVFTIYLPYQAAHPEPSE